MGKTKVNHYVSQYIIKNFKVNECPLYELNCETKNMKERSLRNAFSEHRLWNQNIEDSITKNIENDLAKVITSLHNLPLNISNNKLFAMEVENDEWCDLLHNYLMQSILFLVKNGETIPNHILEHSSKKGFKRKNKQVFYIRYNTNITNITPLVLVDNLIFMDIIPCSDKKNTGRVCYAYPISSNELILVAPFCDAYNFAKIYKFPHLLNMMAIQHQDKKCKVISGNKKYLETIMRDIDSFIPPQGSFSITSMR